MSADTSPPYDLDMPVAQRRQAEAAVGFDIFGLPMRNSVNSKSRTIAASTRSHGSPWHADIEIVEVILVPEEDRQFNDLGIKGLGELGNVGTNAAVANAVFHSIAVTPDTTMRRISDPGHKDPPLPD